MSGAPSHPVRGLARLLGSGSRHGDAPAAGLRESDVAKAAGLAGAQIAANVVAVAFTIVFARWLGTEGYGSLARMISIFVILIVLGSALQVATARETALGRMGSPAECAATLERWTRGLLIATAAVAVASVLLRQQIADAMHVDQVWAAALVAPTGALWVVVAVQRGVLQGLRAYQPVGLSLVGEQFVRLLLSAAFVALGWGVTGALIGMPASVLVVVITLGIVLRRRLGRPAAEPSGERLRDLVMRNRVPIAALTLLAVMQNIDVVVVGHTLSSDESGAYAVAAVAAKGVVWVAVGLGLYLLPEATRESSVGSDPRPLLWRTLAVLALVAVPMVAVYAVAAEPVLRTVFGSDSVLAKDALAWLGVAMSLLAVSYLAVQFQIALQRVRFLWLLALGAVAEPVLLALIGGHLVRIATGLLVLQLVVAAGLIAVSARRPAPAAAPQPESAEPLPAPVQEPA